MPDDQTQTALYTETLDGLAVATDAYDYAPGSTATFTAANAALGGTVKFSVAHTDPGPDGIVGTADDGLLHDLTGTTDPWSVTDGGLGDLDGIANGVVVTSWDVGPDALGQTFQLSATDDSGATATAIFTDAAPPLPSGGVDATAIGSYGPVNGMQIYTFDAANIPVGVPSSTGTGNFAPFLRVQNNPTEQGYNTNAAITPDNFDAKQGTWTHAIRLNDIPITAVNGTAYRVFLIDLNESQQYISLDSLKIYTSSVDNLTGYTGSGFSSGPSTLRYDLDSGIDRTIGLTDGHSSGSGGGDYALLVPYSSLPNDSTNPYVYLDTKFGHEGTLDANWDSDGGFEEIGVRAFTQTTSAIAIDSDDRDGHGGDVAHRRRHQHQDRDGGHLDLHGDQPGQRGAVECCGERQSGGDAHPRQRRHQQQQHSRYWRGMGLSGERDGDCRQL